MEFKTKSPLMNSILQLAHQAIDAVNNGHRVGDSNELLLMDYIISAVEGLQMDYYVPGSKDCAYLSKDTQIDVLRMISEIGNTTVNQEDLIFNITGTISKSFPDALYKCYFIPNSAVLTWQTHYETFNSFNDF